MTTPETVEPPESRRQLGRLVGPRFVRMYANPSGDTFDIPAIREWVRDRLRQSSVSVDPFARNKRWATHTNDLNPKTEAEHHLDAREFLQLLIGRGVRADLIIFDPPYSPRQIKECYESVGLKVTMEDTQNARLYRECRELINEIAVDGAIALSFGWTSIGMARGWVNEQTMFVCHGGAHNDTICVADRRLPVHPILFD